MENKINVAELLKDCPQGMELDCPMYNKVTLLSVDDREDIVFPIRILREDGNSISLTKYGQFTDADFAKCVIFPKGKTTWEGFHRPFKDGDILVGKAKQPFIFQSFNRTNGCFSYCGIDSCECFCLHSDDWTFATSLRFATEEEKEKLFQTIKDNGYKWNADTKTLEKLIEPKFKVGDRIKTSFNVCQYDITELTDTHYILVEVEHKFKYTEPINEDKNWELVLNKLIEPKFKVGDRIRNKTTNRNCIITHKDNLSYYVDSCHFAIWIEEQDKWELVPNKFDISTLKPFDKVLCRQDEYSPWMHSFFGIYSAEATKNPFICSNGFAYKYCIPYEENKHLLGKTDNCIDFYKTWE